jgi:CDP-4-dehydro-6-deoxyglucose reductase
MDVPRHLGHHEVADDMPLITESATVTAVEAMDHNRVEAAEDAIRDLLSQTGDEDLLDEVLEAESWDSFRTSVRDESGLDSETAGNIETLVDRIERAFPSLLRVRVGLDEPFDFAPGQYATLRAFDTPRPYSISNSPNDDDIEFCLRRVPGGTLTSDIFEQLDEGDEVTVRGPNGEMVLDEPTTRDMVFLATGTGVAPYKSMVDYIFEEDRDVVDGQQRDIWLFLGCGWEDDIPYAEAFRAYDDEHDHFHLVPTLTREGLLTEWDGETDYVQQVFLKYLRDEALSGVELSERLAPYRDADPSLDVEARIDPDTIELFACGVTAMVSVLVEAARAVGVPEERMQYEGFG